MNPAIRVVAGQLLAEATYRDVARTLEARDIDHLLLKGPHLGATVYEALWDRDYCDLDVLVRPRDFAAALQALVEEGFTLEAGPVGRVATVGAYYNRSLVSTKGWVVELHRAFAGYGLYRVDYDALFARAEPFRFGQVAARGLAIEDLLLHLVIHAAKGQFSDIGPKHVQDVALLVTRRPIQWEMFERLAREAGCSAAAWVWLSAAAKIFGAPIPEEVLQRIQPSVLRRWWLGLWVTHERFPLLRRSGLPGWLRRLLLAPALIDDFRQGAASGYRFAMVRIGDLIGQPR